LGVTHWSTRLLAAHLGIGDATVARAWRRYCIKPWRRETFKFSTDPQLEAKVRDVVGLYLDPPEKAIVLCVDEKSQIQALNRTAPILPVRPGLPEKATHDYKRNGTTTLFAALEVATGKVTDECYDRHGKAEFLDFLKKVAKAYPRRELHVVVDNYHTHKHDDINAWLAKNPRITLHFTPTSGSWLNLVEVFFGIITRQAIRRGSFESVKELVAAIRTFIEGWNDRCHPFTWTKTADEILPHATRKRDSDARH
jgi:transposase